MDKLCGRQEGAEQASPASRPEARLLDFAEVCGRLAATTKKLEKRALIADYLVGVTIEDAARAALYLAGTPFAETDRRRLQVGGSTLGKAVAQLAGVGGEALSAAYRLRGDLGDAAFDLLAARGWEPVGFSLTLGDLEAALAELAASRGPAGKLRRLLDLLARASSLEARYIIKLISGDMRTGVKQSLVEEAVAVAFGAEATGVRRAVMLNGDLAAVVRMAADRTLGQARMRLFHPLGFMLASPVDSVEEALARFAQEVAIEAVALEAEVASVGSESASPAQSAADAKDAAPAPDDAARERPSLSEAAAVIENAPPSLRAAQLEDKYDGMRAQLHCGDLSQPGRVGLFSRNREDIAESFPELVEAFAGFGEEVVLDGEILAWQPGSLPAPTASISAQAASISAQAACISAQTPSISAPAASPSAATESTSTPNTCHPERSEGPAVDFTGAAGAPGRALPFSSLQQRLGRKRVTAEMRAATPVIFMAFDLLYHASELLLERPLAERRARLQALVAAHAPATAGGVARNQAQGALFAEPAPAPVFPRLLLAPAVQLADAAQLDAAYLDARARGNEGVMLKAAGSLYQPGRRGLAWLKLKRELATLDVVITGAEFGNGRRAGVLSDYTFAVRGPSVGGPGEGEQPDRLGGVDGELLNVGKAYSGLTDVEVDALSRKLHEQTLEDHGHFRTVEPTIVLEVAFNNIMRSERHASGFALRFPRILRIREDKPVDEIDTLARVEEIYASQPDKPVEPSRGMPLNAQRLELDRRVDRYEDDPSAVIPWEELKAKFLKK